jgi:hypothetical protein
MQKWMISSAIFVAAMFLSLMSGVIAHPSLAQAAGGPSPKIGPETVWPQPTDIIKHMGEVEKDLYGYMKRNGASPQAIDFARQNEGEILTKFQKMGSVDLAYMELPIRYASYGGSFLLVNGNPAIVKVGEAMDQINLRGDPALLRKYPKADFFGSGIDFIKMEPLPNGGQRFIFAFDLKNGCNACEVVGEAKVAYDFDASGKFVGTKLLNIKGK